MAQLQLTAASPPFVQREKKKGKKENVKRKTGRLPTSCIQSPI
jgi:hypothetical protein